MSYKSMVGLLWAATQDKGDFSTSFCAFERVTEDQAAIELAEMELIRVF